MGIRRDNMISMGATLYEIPIKDGRILLLVLRFMDCSTCYFRWRLVVIELFKKYLFKKKVMVFFFDR